MAPRPGPLQPYPLELFQAEPSALATPGKRHQRPNKRPYSPGLGFLDSPAKRRLKAEEGIGAPLHTRSPLSASSNSARFAPSHFHALLQGPDSPAKKLDFGSPKPGGSQSGASDSTVCEVSRSESRTPRRSPKNSTTRVRRSPRLSAKASSVGSATPSPESERTDDIDATVSSVRMSPLALEPILIPRAVNPPDPQSIHFPGFIIYQDPHITVPTSSSVSRRPAPEASGSSDDASVSDKEYEKENLPPPRKPKKQGAPMTPSDTPLTKVAVLSPRSAYGSASIGKSKPVPPSPHPKHVRDYLSATHVTPRERTLRTAVSPASTLVGVTPGRTPLGKDARKEMRRALEEEVDAEAVDDDL